MKPTTLKIFYLILLIGLFAIVKVKAQEQPKGQEWKSIVMFHTTRTEVEKRFGKPAETSDKRKFAELYKLDDYNLLVHYAHGCNAGEESDYNIPENTVTHLTVYLKEAIPLNSMSIDNTKFEKTALPSEIYLDNRDEGVTYRISLDEMSIISISYCPKKQDFKQNCSRQSQKNIQ